MLALLKLQNVEAFSTMFLNYDLLAKRWVPYSYVYPFAEGLPGVLIVPGALAWLVCGSLVAYRAPLQGVGSVDAVSGAAETRRSGDVETGCWAVSRLRRTADGRSTAEPLNSQEQDNGGK